MVAAHNKAKARIDRMQSLRASPPNAPSGLVAAARPAVTRTYCSRPPRSRKIPRITERSADSPPVLPCDNAECPLWVKSRHWLGRSLMSALPPKADIVQHEGNVRFVPKAGISLRKLKKFHFGKTRLAKLKENSFEEMS
jgi:hypothetical protein